MNKETSNKLDRMISGYLDDLKQKEEERKQLAKTHIERYHFKNTREMLDYLILMGGKVWKDTSFDKSEDMYIIYSNEKDKLEIYKKDGCGEIEWSYDSMTTIEFIDRYYFSLIPYNGFIQKFHREL